MLLVAGTAGTAALATTAGVKVGNLLVKNQLNSPLQDTGKKDESPVSSLESTNKATTNDVKSNVPSNNSSNSTSSDNFTINSPIENIEMDRPLQELLLYSYLLDVLIIVTVIIIVYLIFSKNIMSFNKKVMQMIKNKFFSVKMKEWIVGKLNKSFVYSDRFFLTLLIINCLLLVGIALFNLYLTSVLYVNIETYIEIHQHFKKGGKF